MIKFDPRKVYLPEEIVQLVNDEAEIKYAKQYIYGPRPAPPKFFTVAVEKNKPGWINFFKRCLNEARP